MTAEANVLADDDDVADIADVADVADAAGARVGAADIAVCAMAAAVAPRAAARIRVRKCRLMQPPRTLSAPPTLMPTDFVPHSVPDVTGADWESIDSELDESGRVLLASASNSVAAQLVELLSLLSADVSESSSVAPVSRRGRVGGMQVLHHSVRDLYAVSVLLCGFRVDEGLPVFMYTPPSTELDAELPVAAAAATEAPARCPAISIRSHFLQLSPSQRARILDFLKYRLAQPIEQVRALSGGVRSTKLVIKTNVTRDEFARTNFVHHPVSILLKGLLHFPFTLIVVVVVC